MGEADLDYEVMSQAQAESRGWEIEDTHHEHWLDDPQVDIAEDHGESSAKVLVVVLILIALFGAAVYLAGKWLEPPAVSFHVTPVIYRPAIIPTGARFWNEPDTPIRNNSFSTGTTCTITTSR